jgi:hypothetical protein
MPFAPVTLWQLLLITVVALLVFTQRNNGSYWRRLGAELGSWLPVFSAETTRGTEAEFIRDRLPQRFPKWLAYLFALGVLGTLLWWWLE